MHESHTAGSGVATAANDVSLDGAPGVSFLEAQDWDGRPANPELSGWYWLARQNGPDLRHAAWYWCDKCHQWEVEPDLSFSAAQTAIDGWRILAPTAPPESAEC